MLLAVGVGFDCARFADDAHHHGHSRSGRMRRVANRGNSATVASAACSANTPHAHTIVHSHSAVIAQSSCLWVRAGPRGAHLCRASRSRLCCCMRAHRFPIRCLGSVKRNAGCTRHPRLPFAAAASVSCLANMCTKLLAETASTSRLCCSRCIRRSELGQAQRQAYVPSCIRICGTSTSKRTSRSLELLCRAVLCS